MYSETESEVKVREDLVSRTRELWLAELLEANDLAQQDGDTHKTDAEIKELAEKTPMRAIYPMLHSSFKLNWQFAEAHLHTEGDLSGSVRTFELSNMPFMLGILETLNRSSLVGQLKHIASTVLPGVHEKLKSSLADAKNGEGGLPEELVNKAAKFLKGKRSLDGTIGTSAAELVKHVEKSFGSDVEQSIRAQFDSFVKDYIETGEEVTQYLIETRTKSEPACVRALSAMKRMQQAVQTVDPKNNGNCLGFGLQLVVFGHNSRQVPISFAPLVIELELRLAELLEKVVDHVIEQVESSSSSGSSSSSSSSSGSSGSSHPNPNP